MWEDLITKLKSKLTANTLIQEVYDYVESNFNGDPVAIIVPSDNEGDYHSTTENTRIYAFKIFLFVSRGNEGGNLSDINSDKAMRQLVDSVLDDFDKDYYLTGFTNPTGYTLLMIEAVNGAWGYAGADMKYRFAEINIRCHVNVDTTLIT